MKNRWANWPNIRTRTPPTTVRADVRMIFHKSDMCGCITSFQNGAPAHESFTEVARVPRSLQREGPPLGRPFPVLVVDSRLESRRCIL